MYRARNRARVSRKLVGTLLVFALIFLAFFELVTKDDSSSRSVKFMFVGMTDKKYANTNTCQTLLAAASFDFPLVTLDTSLLGDSSDLWHILSVVSSEIYLKEPTSGGEHMFLVIFWLREIVFQERFRSEGLFRTLIESQREVPFVASGRAVVKWLLPNGSKDNFTAIVGTLADVRRSVFDKSEIFDADLKFVECTGMYRWRPSQFCFSQSKEVQIQSQFAAFVPLNWGYGKVNSLEKARTSLPEWFPGFCYRDSETPLKQLRTYYIDDSYTDVLNTNSMRLTSSQRIVSRLNSSHIKTLIRSRKLKIPDWLVLTDKVVSSSYGRDLHTFDQVARLLSHLQTLQLAYLSKVDIVAIIEGKWLLCDDIIKEIPAFTNSAPLGYDSIRLLSQSDHDIQHLKMVGDPFLKWFPSAGPVTGYLISRRGIAKVLKVYALLGSDFSTFRIPETRRDEGVIIIDEVISYYTSSYLTTRVNMRAEMRNWETRRIGENENKQNCGEWKNQLFEPLTERVVVFTTARIQSLEAGIEIISLLVDNRATLRRYAQATTWRVYFVLTSLSFMDSILQRINLVFGEATDFSVTVSYDPLRYNKFTFLRSLLPDLHMYDRVLLSDSDMHFTGYAWGDFFNRASSAIIAGTLHRNVEENLSRNAGKPTRQWFKIFDGEWWERNLLDVQAVRIPFIEQAFALIDAEFAFWYFDKILKDEFIYYNSVAGPLPRQSDFGADLLWCGAASEWLKRTRSAQRRTEICVLVALSLLHGDDRQIGQQALDVTEKEVSQQMAFIERQPIEIYKRSFRRWFEYSKQFVKEVGGTSDFGHAFMKKMKKRSIDFSRKSNHKSC